jgi:ATP-dependent Clp protease protease subunit
MAGGPHGGRKKKPARRATEASDDGSFDVDVAPEIAKAIGAAPEPTPTPAPGGPVEGRTIVLAREITLDAVQIFAEELHRLNAQSGGREIIVAITSPGGNLVAGLAIHDLISVNPVPVVTVAFGLAGSAGAIIFQAGHVRLMAPHSRLMIHRAKLDLQATVDADDLDAAKQGILVRERIVDRLFARRTKNSVADVRKWCAEERVFTPKEAVALGFADGGIARVVPNSPLEPRPKARPARKRRAAKKRPASRKKRSR